jgi:hypothetical protein
MESKKEKLDDETSFKTLLKQQIKAPFVCVHSEQERKCVNEHEFNRLCVFPSQTKQIRGWSNLSFEKSIEYQNCSESWIYPSYDTGSTALWIYRNGDSFLTCHEYLGSCEMCSGTFDQRIRQHYYKMEDKIHVEPHVAYFRNEIESDIDDMDYYHGVDGLLAGLARFMYQRFRYSGNSEDDVDDDMKDDIDEYKEWYASLLVWVEKKETTD